ncbi:hypothetical protein HY387_00735 [Candidatus Daviesbacteria bacterium]|nr:hypothetical protein [Candidatus Daviesbacteria bacterium]
MTKEKIITNLAIIYFVIGLLFAIFFAIYYKWPPLSFLSPGFYAVLISWPLQTPGFANDFLIYGLAGKPI